MNQFISLLPLFSLCLGCIGFTSCANLKKVRTVTKTEVKEDMWGRKLNYSVGEDDAGNPRMQSDVRSSFENTGGSSIVSGNNYSGNEYTKKAYRKERWGGESSYKTKSYNNTNKANNYGKEPWFARKQANVNGQESSVGKKSFFTKLFGKSTARERGATDLSKPSDAETNVRRRVFIQPDIIGWKDQQTLSVDDTRGMLGR